MVPRAGLQPTEAVTVGMPFADTQWLGCQHQAQDPGAELRLRGSLRVSLSGGGMHVTEACNC